MRDLKTQYYNRKQYIQYIWKITVNIEEKKQLKNTYYKIVNQNLQIYYKLQAIKNQIYRRPEHIILQKYT